jgi:hypothetical protein
LFTKWQGTTRAIFPNSVIPIEDSVTIGLWESDKTFPNPLWIVGCVAYQGTDGRTHHTKFLYESVIEAGADVQIVLEKPLLKGAPIKEFVLVDSDSD